MPVDKKAIVWGFIYILTNCIGWGKRILASHYSLWQHFWYEYQGIGGEYVRHFSLCHFHLFIFKDLVKEDKEKPATLTLSDGAYSMHARRSEARARRRFCFGPMGVISFLSGG